VIVLGYLGLVNALVLAFNLVPAFPLDGGRVLRSILWASTGNLRRASYWASLAGRGFAWFLIASAMLQLFAGNWQSGIWIGLIGLFLNNAAQSSYMQVVLRQALRGKPVSRFMNRHPIVVSPFLNLKDWVEDVVYRYHRKGYPVLSNGCLEGWIETQALAQIPRAEWYQHTVADVMNRDLQAITISSQSDALQALKKMQQTGSSRLVVTEDDRVVGIISLKDLLEFLDLKAELEGMDQSSESDPVPRLFGSKEERPAESATGTMSVAIPRCSKGERP
jgi:CBS domain-containing protein